MRKTWMGIRSIVNTNRSNFMNPTQFTANGKPVHNPKDVSNTSNNLWCSTRLCTVTLIILTLYK